MYYHVLSQRQFTIYKRGAKVTDGGDLEQTIILLSLYLSLFQITFNTVDTSSFLLCLQQSPYIRSVSLTIIHWHNI